MNDPATRNNVERFAALFQGRTDAYGTGRGYVERKPVTEALYANHLRGLGTGLGIFPVRDDSTVRFGAIDLDEPNFELANELRAYLPEPTYVERSRSGNAHVWVFFNDDAAAWAVKAMLRGATEALGRPHVEVFPKQDRLREGGLGNFINLPYHGPDRPILDPVRPTTLERFLDNVEYQSPDSWVRRARAIGAVPPCEREKAADFGTRTTLHECAEHIYTHRYDNPIREGHRAVVLFNLAKMLLNWAYLTEGEAWGMLTDVNDAAAPPIPEHELQRFFDNAKQGQYTSTGCDDPLMADYVHPDCPIAHDRS